MDHLAPSREKAEKPPADLFPTVRWCREGRWINGKLVNQSGMVIYSEERKPARNRYKAQGAKEIKVPSLEEWLAQTIAQAASEQELDGVA